MYVNLLRGFKWEIKQSIKEPFYMSVHCPAPWRLIPDGSLSTSVTDMIIYHNRIIHFKAYLK